MIWSWLMVVFGGGFCNHQRDASLTMHHGMVTQAVMSIFEALGLKSVQFLDSILPTMLVVIR